MKKTYSAPDIVFESFSLSVSIAACAVETNYGQYECGYKHDPENIIFVSGVSGCKEVVEDGDPVFDGVCYHVPAEDKQLFGS